MDKLDWNSRFTDLPLVLAGPLLRRTTSEAVTVWVALKQSCTVELKIYSTTNAGQQIGDCCLTGRRATIALGQFLHVVAITARTDRTALQCDQIYAYDLCFSTAQRPWELDQALTCDRLPSVNISYFAHQKPTFVLPPDRVEDLQMVQGSCRKTHGEGADALPILDDLIAATAQQPRNRPHQLFLTGDQIYGDDVAEPMLWVATGLGDALLGWQEQLPIGRHDYLEYYVLADLPPGSRADIATAKAGFTAGLRDQRSKATSHLFGLGEYYATYLLAWSPSCWAVSIPKGRQIRRQRQAIRQWDEALAKMEAFVQTLPKVHRALANIPIYMIFDDHDVSDDWNLNRAWCLRVFGQPLGRRVVQNAMLAYAVFQGWGNTPQQFESGQAGEKLLTAAQNWSKSEGCDAEADRAIAQYTGMPVEDATTGLPQLIQEEDVLILDRHPETLTWHYTVESQCHEVIVLDTRTWRGYPADDSADHPDVPLAIAPPMLLCPTAFERQIAIPLQQECPQISPEATFLIAPTNLFGLKVIDWIHQWQLRHGKIFATDVGDAWNVNTDSLAQLLIQLFAKRRVLIVLSGDIHYSLTVRLSYQNIVSPVEPPAVLMQLTCSAMKNEELLTRIIHTRLKHWLLPEPVRQWVGWNHPPRMVERAQRRSHPSPYLPDWFCTLEWIPRQSAQRLGGSFAGNDANRGIWGKIGRRFWQWFQDGQEVVGINNLAMVSFLITDASTARAIAHTLYWRSPWQPSEVFYSRFDCKLMPNSDRL
jgi:hypothetical protein